MARISALALALVPATALAAPRLDAITVQVLAGSGKDVVISVSIERPTLLDLHCDAVIDPGDGTSIPVSWGMGDGRTKTARHEFKRAGNYRVRVAGAGNQGCAGSKEATVSVGTPRAQKTAAPRCPSGWLLVEDSVKGPRYTCRARPPAQALRCPEGTSYFAERGEIGCR
jgi:hypothetical protein